MRQQGLWAASWVVALGLGLALGYLIFSRSGEVALPVGEPEPTTTARVGDPPEPATSDTRDETIAGLRAEVARLKRQKALPSPGAGHPTPAEPEKPSQPHGESVQPAPMPLEPVPPVAPVLKEGLGGLEGFLLDGAGRPQAGVLVRPRHEESDEDYSAKTDGAGFYRISGIAPGYYWIDIGEENGDHQSLWPSKEVEVHPGKFARADFGGPTCAMVSGTAKGPDGRPLGVANLTLISANREEAVLHYEAFIDEKGRFSIAMVEQGQYRWKFRSGQRKNEFHGSGLIRIDKGGAFRWDLSLASTCIAGVVLDDVTGQQLYGARVTISPQGIRGASPASQTAKLGSFRFLGITPGRYQIGVYRKGYAYLIGPQVSVKSNQSLAGIELRLARAVKVTVRVTTGDGLPVKRFDISWFLGEERVNYWLVKETVNGVAFVNDIGPGTYTLVVGGAGYRDSMTKDVQLTTGANPTIEVVLEKEKE